ncbi:hypothetical protein K0M31_007713 [Melipona bicolor]|uniref:Uncharacterized protein n=1 Tax=Melipona bicolor TaxID=60889 RepID=A0AA40GBX4_9HYME|nr:hypothetical protein K0M31_007713 [Melipona bicolor]
MPYIANLACAVKCPELYLPHTTAQSTATQTATPLPITTTQNPLTTPPTVATTKTSPPTSAPTMTTAASPSTTMTPTTMA